MSAPAMAAAPGIVFVSIDKPGLVLGNDDVMLYDGCDGEGCPTCRGYRIVHGYDDGGRGYPVVMVAERHT